MKYLLTIIASVILLMIFADCENQDTVPGCTDSNSLNYNSAATEDDGSCQYYGDLFSGNYTATDTIFKLNSSNDLDTVIVRTNTFSFLKVDNERVKLTGFGNGCDFYARVSLQMLTLLNPENCQYTSFLGVWVTPSQIDYSYFQLSGAGSSTFDYVKGRAVKN